MSATTEKPRFTETTFATLGSRGLCRETAPAGWMGRHDLSVDLAELTGLSFETCSVLVDGTASGLPVELSWDSRGILGQTTATVMIDQLFAPKARGANPSGIAYLRRWGGGHPVYLADVAEAKAPETTYA